MDNKIEVQVGNIMLTSYKIRDFAQAFEKTGNKCVSEALYKVFREMDEGLTELAVILGEVKNP